MNLLFAFTNKKYSKYKSICKILGCKPISKDEFKECFDSQATKGLKKYGHTLADCPESKYNWNLMLAEELVDAFMYVDKLIYIDSK